MAQPGDPLDIGGCARVPNEGSPGPAGPFTIAFLFSTDRYESPDDTELARTRIAGLVSGQSSCYFSPPTLTVPAVPFGVYYVLMVIDADEEVDETDESDNMDAIRLNVGGDYRSGPNLIGTEIELDPASVLPGDRVTIRYTMSNYTIANQNGESGDFSVGYYLRRAFIGDAPFTFLESEEVGSIDATEYEDESEQLTIPPGTPPGPYVLCARLDDTNRVVEWDESNDVCDAMTVADTESRPFLSRADNETSIPRTLVPGREIRVSAGVYNRGPVPAPAAHLGIVLSHDAAYSPDDLVIARLPSAEVPPGVAFPGSAGSIHVRGTVPVPPGLPPGTYVAISVPDVDNVAGLPPGMRQFYGYRYVTVPGAVAADATPARLVTLSAPRPNPTTGEARVTISLEEAGPARLAVYDVLGHEIAALMDGVQPAGERSVAVATGRLAPGVYVVRLTAGGETHTQRLTVVR